VEAVRAAGLLVRTVQHELAADALAKEDRSPVTVADFAAQALIARRLLQQFPAERLVGEESAAALRSEDAAALRDRIAHYVGAVEQHRGADEVCDWIDHGIADPASDEMKGAEGYWTLDPIDGTKGFLRGDQYAVAFAWIAGGKVELGVLGCPELNANAEPDKGGAGCLVLAKRGCGAWIREMESGDSQVDAWRRIATSPTVAPAQARLLRSVEAAHTDADGIGELARRLAVEAAPVGMDSQAKYAVLAAGGGEALLRLLSPKRPDYREKIWDQAAGSIVVEEAGGRVSDLDGKPLNFSLGRTLASNRGVLATNGPLHEAFLAGLRQIGA
ncbi:MAG: 3'(2'),5'-bisphosphate nucleotidase, partial [Planctomycetales bacterium]|nr:3'(2'),5'-bisphosphate nucleotidase [Planctomycetales bacterium]